MTAGTLAAGALVIAGVVLGMPGLGLVGVLALAITGVGRVTAAVGLRGVTFERRLARDRMVWGDEIPLDLVVRNGKALPLALLAAESVVSDGVAVRGRDLAAAERPGWLAIRDAWTLAWYERVVRHLHLVGERRGRFVLGPTRLTVADLFGRDAARMTIDAEIAYVVRPRTVAVRDRGRARAPLGRRRAPSGFHEEPTLFAGVRPYRAGDPPRRIHWRATARTGEPVSRRYDAPRAREAFVALDVQTVDGPYWRRDAVEVRLEELAVVAASLARVLLRDGVAVGFAAAAYTGRRERLAWIGPRTGPDRLATIADALGRMGPHPSAPFESVLVRIPRTVPPGATVHVLTGRDPSPYLAVLRRLAASGYDVRLILVGPAAGAAAGRAGRAGIPAATATLEPDWRTAASVELAA
ncbi:MAG: DUF58 domain-containing protein [Chloroflexi bacterium]|nr:DUF58 domain-containing protein [Chloroflexota bacterium]